jgi:hypothetical protein
MSLSKISMGNISGINEKDMLKASAAAKELSLHLNNAYNADTGKLDLSKLDKSLRSSSTNVQKLSMELLSAGNSG